MTYTCLYICGICTAPVSAVQLLSAIYGVKLGLTTNNGCGVLYAHRVVGTIFEWRWRQCSGSGKWQSRWTCGDWAECVV
ncbi:hypothetical protein V8E52_005132, partial [Russula decolorans]